ncbi:TetR/AcrR family transcriptional regulator [Evansella sp. LMS18]|uniref:TetR/AcrR family transcriptional regulator n=1 Tax=Evansella sp. LMS18 TaxID=2924033 RepID=UPI0034E9722C
MIPIYSKFESLDQEKQERIINAAIKEFVKTGYDKASTNEIVKEAGISKGSLFHYFNNKKDLYLYILDHTLKVIEDNIYTEINFSETDIFKRIGQIGRTKLEVMTTYPQIFDFLKSAAADDSPEVKPDFEEKQKKVLAQGFEKIYENIDWSKFREGIDIEKAVNIINWTMLGYAEKEKEKLISYSEAGVGQLEQWDSYAEILKSCFYKKEGE